MGVPQVFRGPQHVGSPLLRIRRSSAHPNRFLEAVAAERTEVPTGSPHAWTTGLCS